MNSKFGCVGCSPNDGDGTLCEKVWRQSVLCVRRHSVLCLRRHSVLCLRRHSVLCLRRHSVLCVRRHSVLSVILLLKVEKECCFSALFIIDIRRFKEKVFYSHDDMVFDSTNDCQQIMCEVEIVLR